MAGEGGKMGREGSADRDGDRRVREGVRKGKEVKER